MIKIIKVTGESLSPFFLSGDYVIVGKFPLKLGGINVGDIIVFPHPKFGLLIKKVQSVNIETHHFFVEGSHPNSLTSDQIGPINLSTIFGKVLFHIKKPSRLS